MYWLLGSKSQLSIENKYKAILKPIWTYGMQPWSTASNPNMEILQRFQNRYLRIIVNATSPMTVYVMILTCHTLERRVKGSARDRMEEHSNILAINS